MQERARNPPSIKAAMAYNNSEAADFPPVVYHRAGGRPFYPRVAVLTQEQADAMLEFYGVYSSFWHRTSTTNWIVLYKHRSPLGGFWELCNRFTDDGHALGASRAFLGVRPMAYYHRATRKLIEGYKINT